jgi:hypothetical protein
MADTRINVGLDLDGCLVNWNTAFAQVLAKVYGRCLLPLDWKARDPEAFVCWDWDRHYGYPEEVCREARETAYNSDDFWYKLPEYPEARSILDALDWHVQADNINLYFITTRSGARVKQQTEMWLIDRGILTPTVLVSDDKVPILKGLKLDVYVDDRVETINEAFYDGVPGVYLLNRPWNQRGRMEDLPVVRSVAQALDIYALA